MARNPGGELDRRAFLGAPVGFFTLAPMSAGGAGAQDRPGPEPSRPKVVADGGGTSVWALGVRVRVMVRAEETGGAYSVFEDVIPPGGGPPPHTHSRENETIYVVEGSLTAHLGDETHVVEAGTWVHMPVGVEHWFRNHTDRPTRMILTYSPGGFEKWFLEVGTPVGDGDNAPPAHDPNAIRNAIAAAERYGVRFRKPTG
jgi:quercetin dioxygenase-like cupin family protein